MKQDKGNSLASSGMSEPLVSGLGAFAASINLADVPNDAKHQATLCILDTMGCIVLGANAPDGQMFLAAEKARGGSPEAPVYGTKERLPVEAAARVNGYMGDIFELNDLLAGHPSIGIIPAVLALGEKLNSSGADVLKAVIAGLETTSRVYASYRGNERLYPEIGNGFVGYMNTLGVAAAASSLFKLDGKKTADAIAVAGALAGWCPAEALFRQGGTIKPILFGGWPASVGIQGTLYAMAGIDGPLSQLEGDFGFLRAISYKFDPTVILSPGRWFVSEPRRKLHACCGYIHSSVDVMAEIRRKHGDAIFSDGPINISMLPRVLDAVSKTYPPKTQNEARFHLEFCVALAATGADVILPEHSSDVAKHLADPKVQSIMQRLNLIQEPNFKNYYECLIELTGSDGTKLSGSGKAPKGSPANPLTDSEVIEKFQRLTSSHLSQAQSLAYAERVQKIESEPNCKWLATALLNP